MFPMLRKIVRTGIVSEAPPDADEALRVTAQRLSAAMQKEIGRALVIRHIDAGSCNGCELEIHALNNPYYNLEALGIKFAASPRHADLLLVTGPVAKNMETAVKRAYDATPEPKLVVSVGDCGCTGGIFGEIIESIRLIHKLLADLPQGAIRKEVRSEPDREGFGWIEGWRGDIFVALETGSDGKVRRCHCHDPSWQNWPALEHAVIDNIVPDFPLINKSFNLSYAGPDL